jgi:hypothetical protein
MFKLTHQHGFNKQRVRPLTSVSYVANAPGANITSVDLTGLTLRAGDLLVLLWHAENGDSFVLPSGFTLIGSIDDAAEMSAAYKISDGTETAVAVPFNSDFNTAQVMQFRGDVPILSVTVAGYQSVVTSGNPASQTILSGSGVAPVLVIADFMPPVPTTPADAALSPTTGASSTGSAAADNFEFAMFAIWNTAPINTACDIGDRGSFNGMQSFYVSLA